MDEDHAWSPWTSHSYENIYFIQERYESVAMSSQNVDQTRAISTLIHKGKVRVRPEDDGTCRYMHVHAFDIMFIVCETWYHKKKV